MAPPPQRSTALEEDEGRLGMNRRDYIHHLSLRAHAGDRESSAGQVEEVTNFQTG